MKKYFILLLILFLMPYMVFADEAGPSILGYDAVVINKNGAESNSLDENMKKIVVPYNKVVHIGNEWEDRAHIFCQSDETDNYCGVDISLKDIMPVKKEIIPTMKDANDKNSSIEKYTGKIIVFEEKGIKLKKGPADIYGSYDDLIPYMTYLKVQYVVSSYDPEGTYYPWYYVDDGQYKGWIFYNDTGHIDDELMLFADTKMVDDNNKVLLTIPKGTLLKNAYRIHLLGKRYYLEYNNQKGYIDIYNCENYENIYPFKVGKNIKNVGMLIALKETKILSEKDEVITTIPAGEEITLLYGNYLGKFNELSPVCLKNNACYYYVEYNNKKGFISSDNIFGIVKYDVQKSKLLLNEELTIYGVEDFLSLDESKKLGTIPKGVEVISYYNAEFGRDELGKLSKWYLVYYNNKMGFISGNIKILKMESKNNDNEKSVTIPSKNNPPVNKPSDITPILEPSKEPTERTESTLIYAIIGAVVLCVVSFITIVLINKNKANKRDMAKEIKDSSKESVTNKREVSEAELTGKDKKE